MRYKRVVLTAVIIVLELIFTDVFMLESYELDEKVLHNNYIPTKKVIYSFCNKDIQEEDSEHSVNRRR